MKWAICLPDCTPQHGQSSVLGSVTSSQSDRRLQLCQRLKQLVEDARASAIMTRILVGGSMVRAAAEPNDFDCIVVLRADIQYTTLRPDQLWVADSRIARDRYMGDIFIAREGQSTLPLYIDFFSHNRDGKIVGMIEVTP